MHTFVSCHSISQLFQCSFIFPGKCVRERASTRERMHSKLRNSSIRYLENVSEESEKTETKPTTRNAKRLFRFHRLRCGGGRASEWAKRARECDLENECGMWRMEMDRPTNRLKQFMCVTIKYVIHVIHHHFNLKDRALVGARANHAFTVCARVLIPASIVFALFNRLRCCFSMYQFSVLFE